MIKRSSAKAGGLVFALTIETAPIMKGVICYGQTEDLYMQMGQI